MKKSLLFLSLLTSVSLTSCGGNEPSFEKVNLKYGYIADTAVTEKEQLEIGYSTLKDMVDDKESFILLLFHDRTCGCWKWELGPIAVEYMNKYNIKLYAFDNALLVGETDTFGLYTRTDNVPGICFFEKGKLLRQTIYRRLDEKHRQMFKDLDAFSAFVNENCYLPKMYYIEKEKLDAKISNNDDFNLYVTKSGCPDCGKIEEEYVDKWIETNKLLEVKEMLYVFDVKKYNDTPEYQTIKDAYGLSVAGNSIFGYGNGFMPTFQRREQGKITDMITVLNDSADKDTGLVTSYFTAARIAASPILSKAQFDVIDGTTIDTSFILPWGGINQQKQLEWHLPATEMFFDTYVK